MELYILDNDYRRMHVIDSFESLIWAERFQDIGDFELKIKSNRDWRMLLLEDTWMGMSKSNRIMAIEEIEDLIDEDGEFLLVRGRSYERVLQERFLMEERGSTSPWYVTTSPIGAPRYIFDWVFGNPDNPLAEEPQLHNGDAIPNLVGRTVPPDQFAIDDGVEEIIDWVLRRPDYLYNEIRKACLPYDLGFRIVLEDTDGEPHLYFEVYTGRDLTTRQSDREPVIFSIDMGNLEDSVHYRNYRDYKNIAYVYTADGTNFFVTREGFDTGWGQEFGESRRMLLIETSIPSDWTDPDWEYLQKVGREVLEEQNRLGVDIYDGKVNQELEYEYGVDYELGDIVEFRNRHGERIFRHISEQIFVSDLNGERSYPTLSIGKFDQDETWRMYSKPQQGVDTWYDLSATQKAWEDA